MAHYKVIIAYDGYEFSGFQRQVNTRTVQGEIEKALRIIGQGEKSILFSGRTDTGVHAEGQVIAFQLNWIHAESQLIKALNCYLPPDISAIHVEAVNKDFHPRFTAKERIYRYQMYQGFIRKCLLDRYHWRVWPAVDLFKLRNATKLFLGKHDFKHFGRPPDEKTTTVRTIKSAEWRILENGTVHFHITAEAFLYHMVRRIVFLIVKAGQGMLPEDEITAALLGEDNLPAGIAPANGLFLEKVEY
jgi:tRNA pseudouridine38-40 synthase